MSSHVYPAPHFRSFEQQHEASELGMWGFLCTEILFFGGVLCGYTMYRLLYPQAWVHGSELNSLWLGAAMTVVLLASSLTMALAVRAAQLGQSKVIVGFLAVTIALGIGFLVLKGYEYYGHWVHHLVPGFNFSGYQAPDHPQVALFVVFYFFLTLLHAVHMIIGVGVLSVIAMMARRDRFSAIDHGPVEIAGLYWHFVDIVWLFLFPLLYLVGAHQ